MRTRSDIAIYREDRLSKSPLRDPRDDINRINSERITAGLSSLDVDAELVAAYRHRQYLIDQARADRRARFGDRFADNWFSRLGCGIETAPAFEEYLEALRHRS